MSALVYEDKLQYSAGYCYAVINEHLSSWREAIAQVPDFKAERAASICSGGEVGMFLLLPHVKKELLMIDYSYQSMYFAIGKYATIEELGTRKAHQVFSQQAKEDREYKAKMDEWYRIYDKFMDAYYYKGGVYPTPGVTPGFPEAPEPVRANPEVFEIFEKANAGMPENNRKQAHANWPMHGLDKVWQDIPQKEVTHFRANKHKVSFLHADLSHLEEIGPFDFVYLSNALQYTSAKHRQAGGNSYNSLYYPRRGTGQYAMSKIVKPGGFVLYCDQRGERGPYRAPGAKPNPDDPGTWDHVANVAAKGHKYGMYWTHRIAQAPA